MVNVKISKVQMTDGGQRIKLQADYHPDLPELARQLNGKFNYDTKAWYFDPRDEERVREIARDIFGTDGTDTPEIVTIRVNVNPIHHFDSGDSLWLAGRQIAYRPARDARVRLGDGVIILTGGFADRGGSRNHPELSPLPDTVLEVRDVPKVLALREKERYPETIELVISDEESNKLQQLLARKEALLQELQELEMEINKLQGKEAEESGEN